MSDELLQYIAQEVRCIRDKQSEIDAGMRAGFANGTQRFAQLEEKAHSPNDCASIKRVEALLEQMAGARTAGKVAWGVCVVIGGAIVWIVDKFWK